MIDSSLLFLIGRVVLGGYFVYTGLNHFINYQGLRAYAQSWNTPLPGVAVVVGGLMLLLGGLSVAFGVYPAYGLTLLALFFLGVTPKMHAFWKVKDPAARSGEVSNFLRNAAFFGAVVALAVVPSPWPLSLGL